MVQRSGLQPGPWSAFAVGNRSSASHDRLAACQTHWNGRLSRQEQASDRRRASPVGGGSGSSVVSGPAGTGGRGRKPGLTLAELLAAAQAELQAAGIELPRFEAELLLSSATGLSRERLIAASREPLPRPQAAAFWRLVARRAGHEPLAYITGRKEFMSLDLIVTPDVLIPRPDTELLVEQALAFLARRIVAPAQPAGGGNAPAPWVIDVGTGSGAVALAVAHYQPAAIVWAIDVSPRAARIAERNAAALGLSNRVTVLTGDLLDLRRPSTPPPGGAAAAAAGAAGGADLILANLPYVHAGAFATLAPEVAAFEPRLALDGGPDGLSLIRRLAPQAAAALGPHGALGLECDPAQCTLVSQLLLQAGFRKVLIRPDLAGLERTVWGFRDGQADPG